MFTGIIQDTGKVTRKRAKGDGIEFYVKPCKKSFLKDVKPGDSISINGACMTVESAGKKKFRFTAVKETLSKTNLELLNENDFVNLEKAITIKSKFDGHFVQGHIDTTAVIDSIKKNKSSTEYFINIPPEYNSNIIPVGSIAVNGVSLTIAGIVSESSESILIKVAIIPHTFKKTTFRLLKKNDSVNIEFDMLGKYVRKILK